MKIFQVKRVDHGPGGTDAHGAAGHVFVSVPRHVGDEREYAKREAQRILGGNPDRYIVEPLTNHGEPVTLHFSFIYSAT